MRVVKDSHVDYSSDRLREQIPVLNLATSAPLSGSVALSTPTITPYYANGTAWLPFGGAAALESAKLSRVAGGQTIITDSTFYNIPFDTDSSPLTPAHPSITVDVPNSQFIVNTTGNYILYYNVTFSNTQLYSTTQPELYTAYMLVSSVSSGVAVDTVNGGFNLNGAVLAPPSGNPITEGSVALVNLSGTWSGTLTSGTTVVTIVAINTATTSTEFIEANGDQLTYMGIIRIA
jgi:hypothetical protein